MKTLYWEGIAIIIAKRLQSRTGLRIMFSFILIFALVMSSAVQTFAAETVEKPVGAQLTPESAVEFLDNFFASEQAEPFYTGAAVTIVNNGQVIAQEGYGFADAEQQIEVDPEHTIFRVASVSKTFTAVAIMQLAEQGKLELDEDIRTYLPGVEFDNPFDSPVTVAHLLRHESGLEVRDPQLDDLHTDLDRYVPMEDYVNKHMPSVVREPGTAYLYDNFAYLLLGLIVQNVSEQPYEEYMAEHIFEPLGMENSGFVLEGKFLEQLATGYDAGKQPMEPYVLTPTIMPHGGMLATADDIGKFMIAFLNEGIYGTEQILSEQSIEEMSVYRSSIHPLLPNTTYGFEAAGQTPLSGSSEAVLTKLGDLPGNSSMLLLLPEEDTGVFLTYNLQGTLRDLFYAQFMSAFYPEYVTPAELGEFQPYAADELAYLEGYYSDLRLSTIVSKVEVTGEGKLAISDVFLGPRELTQVDDNLFVDQLAQRFTAFTVDETSGLIYMKEPYLNPLGYSRKGAVPAGFADVDADHVYLPYIQALQSLGYYENDAEALFGPEEPVTRAELIYDLLRISGVKGSDSTDYAFSDIASHDLAPYIQMGHEAGMISGNGEGLFEPNRSATRQEVAVMVWNAYRHLYPDELFSVVQLSGETDDWAVPAVKMMVALGIYGPEVAVSEDGSVDYLSRETLTRQEAAAIYYQLLQQPVDQIVAQLMQQQDAAA